MRTPHPDAGPGGLTHLDAAGHARMVDVGHKPPMRRTATAAVRVRCTPGAARAMADGIVPKGDVAALARAAGIMAAKRTPEWVILAHPLPLSGAEVQVRVDPEAGEIDIRAIVRTTGSTGVEMEALTACAAAALNVFDMLKALDPHQVIGDLRVVEKRKEPIG